MKRILLFAFFCTFIFSQKISATPIDFIKPISPTEKSIHSKKKKKKKKFFARMTEKIMKRRIGKMIKKLNLDPSNCARIIKTDGEEIEVIIVKVGAERIRYKKCDFQNGPTRTIRKEDIFMIKYADGTKEMMTDIEALKKNQKPIETTANQNKNKSNQNWAMGYLIGLLLGLLGLLVIVIFLTGERRKQAIRGSIGGILTRILIVLTITLILSSII